MDAAEFELVVRAVERQLGSFLVQMVPGRALAEDLLQETMLVAWRERARMPAGVDERRAWMYGVARHQALHALRKRRRGRAALDSISASEERPEVGEPSDALAMRELLAQALSPRDRSLFVLRYVHGFTAESLASMTGQRRATVRKRLERAAATLRRVLDPETPEKEDDHARSTALA